MLRRGRDPARVPVDSGADRSAVELARRDPRAFEALYRKYVAQIYSFAFYELRDQHAAEDLTAQVFLRALAGLPRFREQIEPPDSSFKVWLFQIARNALSNERRRARRHPVAPLDLAADVPATDDPQAAATRRADVQRAWAAIEQLPDDRRRAIVLRFVNEMSASEIGRILGRSEGATRVLIHRSLQAVARQLGRAEVKGVGRTQRRRATH